MARKRKGLVEELIDVAAKAGGAKRSRRSTKGKPPQGWALLLLVVLVVIGYFAQNWFTGPVPEPGDHVYAVKRCVDGDTLLLDDGSAKGLRVRLIGANTPETVKPNWPVEPFGPEASEFTKRTIAEAGNRVRLAYDGDQTDKFGRTLALVYVETPQGEIMLNEQLIREGLATAELKYNYSQATKNLFQQAENEAKAAKRNLWEESERVSK